MLDVTDWCTSTIVGPFFTTLMCVLANFAIHLFLQSYPMEIKEPDWRWGNMCDFIAVDIRRWFRFISYLWVARMRLPSDNIA